MRRDKKVRDGALKFVLVRGIGQAFTAPMCRGRGDRAAARRGVRGVGAEGAMFPVKRDPCKETHFRM